MGPERRFVTTQPAAPPHARPGCLLPPRLRPWGQRAAPTTRGAPAPLAPQPPRRPLPDRRQSLGSAGRVDGQAREGTAACFLGERAACAVQGQTRERAAPRHRCLVRSGGRRGRGDQAIGSYKNFLKASRSKAVSSRRCSSVRWVFLLPVAGAAAGSRPAYHTGLARLMVVRSRGFT